MRDFLEVMQEGEKLESSLKHRASRIANFAEKLEGFMSLITNKSGMSAHKRSYLMKEAETTSDFPILFGTVLERQLIARYQTAKSEWRTYTKTGTQNDFRSNNIIGVFGLESELPQVAERGEYKADKLADGKVANSLKKYGRSFPLSWETLINDDLGAFSDLSSRLAASAINTEYLNSTRLYVDAAGPIATLFGNSLSHPIDGGVLDNLTTDLFDVDALGDAITAMRQQKDYNGNPVIVERFHLVVGPNLEIPALKALSQGALIAGGGSTGVVTSENVIAKLPITLHVNPFQPIVYTAGHEPWFLFGENGGNTPAIQMNFLRGHEAPEVVQRQSNKVSLGGGAMSATEGDFETDTMAWRVRHIMGGTQVDPRFAYASDATGS
jgi:hypothetical protein